MTTRRELSNAIRMLTVDAVQKANSGHPGMPLGMADIAEVLWNDFLRHNPGNPKWFNRDRFIISNGHGAMLHYALLHLTGYDLTLEDLQNFRQLHSKTPGHPEFGHTVGIETTTGPLGQGFANAVGMAIAEMALAAQFNRGGVNIIDHYTYVFLGDGCLMEGISHEAASLAGTLKLGKLIAFYDDNGISIDGHTSGWFTDDTPKRFEAYHWHVVPHVDGHDAEAIYAAIEEARSITDRPSLICCKTHIAYGAPTLIGSHKSHGAPLGETEIAAMREQLGWHYVPFDIPDNIYEGWDATVLGAELEAQWLDRLEDYRRISPVMADELQRRIAGNLPDNWEIKALSFIRGISQKTPEDMATRKASEHCLNQYYPLLPELFGGSADLTHSNNTWSSHSHTFGADSPEGNYLHYGVREFGMFAMMNGLALHGGFIPYGGTFLTFVDYGRNALRLAAMMKQRVIYVLSHDSIGLGEDGPTHQPVEHINMLRLTPNVSVWRPCDWVETAVAWKYAIEHSTGPTCLLLSRQNLPQQPRDPRTMLHIKYGGYVLADCRGKPEAIIMATGSEVVIAMEAAAYLTEHGYNIRVVSMPSTTVFDQQDSSYQESVLPYSVPVRVAVEAGSTGFWHKYVGLEGIIIGLDRYGESAPYQQVYEAVGLTAANVIKAVKSLL